MKKMLTTQLTRKQAVLWAIATTTMTGAISYHLYHVMGYGHGVAAAYMGMFTSILAGGLVLRDMAIHGYDSLMGKIVKTAK